MKTYLVRTANDQTLVGIFCAKTLAGLKKVVSALVEINECEYLELQDKEGLFVEAQFLSIPAELTGGMPKVGLTNEPEQFGFANEGELSERSPTTGRPIEVDALEHSGSLAKALQEEGSPLAQALREAMQEVIPPVLEPTEGLSIRLAQVERSGWQKLRQGKPSVSSSVPIPPQSSYAFMVIEKSGSVH